jgi:hypothetical protein
MHCKPLPYHPALRWDTYPSEGIFFFNLGDGRGSERLLRMRAGCKTR